MRGGETSPGEVTVAVASVRWGARGEAGAGRRRPFKAPGGQKQGARSKKKKKEKREERKEEGRDRGEGKKDVIWKRTPGSVSRRRLRIIA